MMTADQLRKKYLDFFSQRNHAILPSAGLIPDNDPTTLFTGSGMQPLMPYFLGAPHPLGLRVTNSQKCFRTQDIEEVGDNRHTTFFEMLGNWSFGDYYKKEQLGWFFQFLTGAIGLDPNRLYVSVYRGDQAIGVPKDTESPEIWQKLFTQAGVEAKIVEDPANQGIAGRIFYYGDKNWWSRAGAPATMPVGELGGPDSEVFFDFGAQLKLHEQSVFKDQLCHPNCDCGRFLEIGNSVFMQYQTTEKSQFVELQNKNVDFGGGLERILAAANDQPDLFKLDIIWPVAQKLAELTTQSYDSHRHAYRVIMDHVRAATMLASDGVYPSNKEQGYFARRLLRRAIRFAKTIGINDLFLAQLVPVVAKIYQPSYPNVWSGQARICQIFADEERKFSKTLDKGLKEMAKLSQIDGISAFRLYETYGFPLELTVEIAQERGQVIDQVVFRQEFAKHRDQSRTASAGKFKGGLADSTQATTRFHTATHLLNAALGQVLGLQVRQMGSHITAQRARFDFGFSRALTITEKNQLESLVNSWVDQACPVTKQTLPKQDALDSGAVAVFQERYPDIVTVYCIGSEDNLQIISKEVCGGPHVTNTSQIGHIKIAKEQSSSAGVRRIYMEFV